MQTQREVRHTSAWPLFFCCQSQSRAFVFRCSGRHRSLPLHANSIAFSLSKHCFYTLGVLLSDANSIAFATREGGGGMIFVCISFGRMTKMMYLCSGKWRTAPAVAKNTKRATLCQTFQNAGS